MFKQLEYSEILFKNSLVKFDRCVRDECSIDTELVSVSIKINLTFRSLIHRRKTADYNFIEMY